MFVVIGPRGLQANQFQPSAMQLAMPGPMPCGFRGVVTIRFCGDRPPPLAFGERATLGLPAGAARPARAGLDALLRRLIGAGRVVRRPSAPRAARPVVGARDRAGEAERLLALVNAERAKVGAPAVKLDRGLGTVARRHSEDMARRGYFGHDTPEGKTFWQRAAEAGQAAGAENIAGGQRSAEAVMAGWMNSPAHRANILNPAWTRMGVGEAGARWTQLFG